MALFRIGVMQQHGLDQPAYFAQVLNGCQVLAAEGCHRMDYELARPEAYDGNGAPMLSAQHRQGVVQSPEIFGDLFHSIYSG